MIPDLISLSICDISDLGGQPSEKLQEADPTCQHVHCWNFVLCDFDATLIVCWTSSCSAMEAISIASLPVRCSRFKSVLSRMYFRSDLYTACSRAFFLNHKVGPPGFLSFSATLYSGWISSVGSPQSVFTGLQVLGHALELSTHPTSYKIPSHRIALLWILSAYREGMY